MKQTDLLWGLCSQRSTRWRFIQSVGATSNGVRNTSY